MPNINQNNDIRIINTEISLLKDRLKKNKKSLNQFKNGFRQIRRLQIKQGKTTKYFWNQTSTRNIEGYI